MLRQANIIIIDQDGTLFPLNGKDRGFQESTLQKQVLRNSIQFIMLKEQSNKQKAKDVLRLAQNSGIGFSWFMAKRYRISRENYFNQTWNIDPRVVIDNRYNKAVLFLREAVKLGKKLVLLTSSPRIWQKAVASYLAIEDLFSEVITGESFKLKEEVFIRIKKIYGADKVFSIGDQLETDINPAINLGMGAFLITDQDNYIRLTSLMKGDDND